MGRRGVGVENVRNLLICLSPAGHIRRTDGFAGCFVGLGPKLMGTIVAAFGAERITKWLGFAEIVDNRRSETLTDRE